MSNDITALAHNYELLIANGQQTADLLRHLADNEIDSDYFAVVSECESYGKETDAEISITDFALRAAGYVDALVEALEKAQQQIQSHERAELTWMNALDLPDEATRNDILPAIHAEKYLRFSANTHISKLERANAAQDNHINQQQDRIDVLEKRNAELGKYAGELESRTAFMEWHDKTEWVQNDKCFDVVRPLGKHRADVLREYIKHLEREKDAIEAVALALRDDMRQAREKLEAAERRIAELEARQIALPQRLSPEGYHIDEAYMVDDVEGEYLDRDAVIKAISTAGIKVKGE